VKKLYCARLGMKEIKLSEQLSIFAGDKEKPIILLTPGTIITKMPERVEYKIEEVDVTDLDNPKLFVSRAGNIYTVTKEQIKNFKTF
tara:strand:+ start:508 stop:768 length:261 start_codon:yes stop_codon:yes gene_type:complete